jgi:hemerythrin-like domain-containing protein
MNTTSVTSTEPLDLLTACHDHVRRSLEQLQHLVQQLRENGAGEETRSAARDVLGYFADAAPAHHEDEERHVFPLLRETGDTALIEAAGRLHEDHVALAGCWQSLAPLLQSVADGTFEGDLDSLAGAASAFTALYERHLAVEDNTVFGLRKLA